MAVVHQVIKQARGHRPILRGLHTSLPVHASRAVLHFVHVPLYHLGAGYLKSHTFFFFIDHGVSFFLFFFYICS